MPPNVECVSQALEEKRSLAPAAKSQTSVAHGHFGGSCRHDEAQRLSCRLECRRLANGPRCDGDFSSPSSRAQINAPGM